MMLVHKALHKVTRPVTVVYHKTPHVEHTGFVSLAACEVWHLHYLIFYVNVVLLVSGVLAVLYETFHLEIGGE